MAAVRGGAGANRPPPPISNSLRGRRALAAIPLAVDTLLTLAARVRTGKIAFDDLILFSETSEPTAAKIRAVLRVFSRLRRLEHSVFGTPSR